MANKPPDYCPHCGGELTAVDPPTVHRCDACDRLAFYNPTPSARVAVVDSGGGSSAGSGAKSRDRDAILLCEVGVEGVEDHWETPGGRLEAAEDPPVAAARELREETGLRVDPVDLTLFDVRSFETVPDQYKTRLCYAVDRSDAEGTLRAGTEPDSVRFWSPEAFADAGMVLSGRQPEATRELSWWLSSARDALDGSRVTTDT